MPTESREIGHFQTKADDGTIYEVVEWQHYTKEEGSGWIDWVRGTIDFRLLDGSELIQVDIGVFQIAETDEIIRQIG